MDQHKNFAYSTVATAPAPAASGTSLVVAAGDGARFPTPPFNAVVWPAGAIPLASNAEVLRVSGIATDTLTIARQQESSVARTVVVGDQVAAVITNKTITDTETVALVEAEYRLVPDGRGLYVAGNYEVGVGVEVEIGVGANLEVSN